MAQELLAAVEAFQLKDCWQWKPLLDGKQVMQVRGAAQRQALLRVMYSSCACVNMGCGS